MAQISAIVQFPASGTPQNYVQDCSKLRKDRSSDRTRHSFASSMLDCAATCPLPRNAGRGLIWVYRHTLSPLVGYNCRHLPTCSVYGDEAIERYGLWAGGWMTLARLSLPALGHVGH